MPGDFGRAVINGEVTRVKQMQLGIGLLAANRIGAIHRKDGIMDAPYDERGWSAFAQVRLPLWIGCDVRLIVMDQVELDGIHAWTFEESDFVHPQIRVEAFRMRAPADMSCDAALHRVHPFPDSHLVSRTLGPEGTPRVPHIGQPVFVKNGVLNDQRLNPFRLSDGYYQAMSTRDAIYPRCTDASRLLMRVFLRQYTGGAAPAASEPRRIAGLSPGVRLPESLSIVSCPVFVRANPCTQARKADCSRDSGHGSSGHFVKIGHFL